MPNNNAQLGASSEIEMANGTTVPLLITWGLLLRMSALDKDLCTSDSASWSPPASRKTS